MSTTTPAPHVVGYRIDAAHVRIVCPWCGDHHHHGSHAGHRVAHCPARIDSGLGYVVEKIVDAPAPLAEPLEPLSTILGVSVGQAWTAALGDHALLQLCVRRGRRVFARRSAILSFFRRDAARAEARER